MTRTLKHLALATTLATTLALAGTSSHALAVFTPNLKATYLRTNGESPPTPAPLVLDLAAYGWSAGQRLLLQTTGDFDNGPNGDDFFRSIGIFSASSTLLPLNLQVRVPDAIDAGALPFVTAPTFFGGLATDVPEDFLFGQDGTEVQVPQGATHLFLAVYDSLYQDNSDPNGDFRFQIQALPPVPEPGAWALLLAGLGAIGWQRRRQTRR